MTPYLRTPCSLKTSAMRQAIFDGADELLAVLVVAHGGITDRARPDRRDERADGEALARDHVGDRLQVVVAGIGIGVRKKEEVVDAVELLAVHFGGGGQFEHRSRLIGGPGRRRLLCRRDRATWRCEVWGESSNSYLAPYWIVDFDFDR